MCRLVSASVGRAFTEPRVASGQEMAKVPDKSIAFLVVSGDKIEIQFCRCVGRCRPMSVEPSQSPGPLLACHPLSHLASSSFGATIKYVMGSRVGGTTSHSIVCWRPREVCVDRPQLTLTLNPNSPEKGANLNHKP